VTVYVDRPIHAGLNGPAARLFADTAAELHAMAALIGLRTVWFRPRPQAQWPHYLVSTGMRFQAIRHGAIATDLHGLNEMVARQHGNQAVLDQIAFDRRARMSA
jgi:hypothetical protein